MVLNLCLALHFFLVLMCVQEVVTHFMQYKLLYKMGHYFLDTQYVQEVLIQYPGSALGQTRGTNGPAETSFIF